MRLDRVEKTEEARLHLVTTKLPSDEDGALVAGDAGLKAGACVGWEVGSREVSEETRSGIRRAWALRIRLEAWVATAKVAATRTFRARTVRALVVRALVCRGSASGVAIIRQAVIALRR
jgi:hypothetical protein